MKYIIFTFVIYIIARIFVTDMVFSAICTLRILQIHRWIITLDVL